MLRAFLVLTVLAVALPVHAQVDPRKPMMLNRLGLFIKAVDGEAQRSADDGVWQFSIVDIVVSVVTDESHDRMRILVPINYVKDMDAQLLMRIMQANFDTALDTRYTTAQDILWSTFIHPLNPLTDEQFLSGAGQVVNLAETFGTTYSSDGLSYVGGVRTSDVEGAA